MGPIPMLILTCLPLSLYTVPLKSQLSHFRTMGESFQAMEYIAESGKFTSQWEINAAYYLGSFVMYFVGRRVKAKYNLKDDVRRSLYDEAQLWCHSVGTYIPLMLSSPSCFDT